MRSTDTNGDERQGPPSGLAPLRSALVKALLGEPSTSPVVTALVQLLEACFRDEYDAGHNAGYEEGFNAGGQEVHRLYHGCDEGPPLPPPARLSPEHAR